MRAGPIQVELYALPADYDLALTDLAGTVLERSARTGRGSEKIRTTLAAGRYLIAVVPKEGEFDKRHYRVKASRTG